MYSLDFFGFSEIGGRRSNQDAYYLPEARDGELFIVCDGVGGVPGGEIASGKVCEVLPGFFNGDRNYRYLPDYLHRQLKKFIYEIPAEKIRASTTLAFVRFIENKCLFGWCGDSRILQFRNRSIIFQSRDHSLVNELVQMGEISESQAESDFRKHIILQSVDFMEPPKVEFKNQHNLQSGDIIVLVTDGILEVLRATDLLNIFSGEIEFEKIEGRIKELCKDSPDNFTMVAVRIN